MASATSSATGPRADPCAPPARVAGRRGPQSARSRRAGRSRHPSAGWRWWHASGWCPSPMVWPSGSALATSRLPSARRGSGLVVDDHRPAVRGSAAPGQRCGPAHRSGPPAGTARRCGWSATGRPAPAPLPGSSSAPAAIPSAARRVIMLGSRHAFPLARRCCHAHSSPRRPPLARLSARRCDATGVCRIAAQRPASTRATITTISAPMVEIRICSP